MVKMFLGIDESLVGRYFELSVHALDAFLRVEVEHAQHGHVGQEVHGIHCWVLYITTACDCIIGLLRFVTSPFPDNTNLFVKPNEQRQSREDLSDAMARKGRMKSKEQHSPLTFIHSLLL